MPKKKYTLNEVSAIVAKATNSQLQEFIARKILTDSEFAQEIAQFIEGLGNERTDTSESVQSDNASKLSDIAAYPISSDEFEEQVFDKINNVIEGHHADYRFLYYKETVDFTNELYHIVEEFISQTSFMDNNEMLNSRVALELLVLSVYDPLDFDDSCGSLSSLISLIIGDMRQLYKEGDTQRRRILLEQCLDYLKEYSKHLDYIACEVEDFVLEFDDPDLDNDLEKFIDSEIKKMSPNTYRIGSYILAKLKLLLRKGATQKEIFSYATPYWRIEKVLRWLIDYFKENGQLDLVTELLQYGIDNYPSYKISDFKIELKDVLLQRGEKEKYTQMLLDIIRSSSIIQMKEYRELKELYTPQQWDQVSRNIIDDKTGSPRIQAAYLLEEGLLDELAALIFSNSSDYILFDSYASDLPEKYTSKIQSRYRKELEEMARDAKARPYYDMLIDSLERVNEAPGGYELTDSLSKEWLTKYKRKTILCQKLRDFRSKYSDKFKQ